MAYIWCLLTNNFVDVALDYFDNTSKFDDLVLSTLQISSILCWVIKSIKFCSYVIDIFDL
jgi:hypothetical protein